MIGSEVGGGVVEDIWRKGFGGKRSLVGSNVIFPRFIPTNYGAKAKLEDLP
jgi:hypothetical protein